MSTSLVEVTSSIVERSLKESTCTRVPCVLVLDSSGSMSEYGKIDKLNQGLKAYAEQLRGHELACKMVETAVVQFGPVAVRTSFTTADEFTPPQLTASGTTPMGAAVLRAIQLTEERVSAYRAHGIQYYRPWIILLTDGMPDSNDPIDKAIAAVAEGQAARRFTFHAVGVGDQGTDFGTLQRLSPSAKQLSDLKFVELFQWLSTTMSIRAVSMPGDKVSLPTISSWAEDTI